MNNLDLMNYWIKSSDKDYDVMLDYRIEPHIIEIADFENVETPFVAEVINTGIKVA